MFCFWAKGFEGYQGPPTLAQSQPDSARAPARAMKKKMRELLKIMADLGG